MLINNRIFKYRKNAQLLMHIKFTEAECKDQEEMGKT